MPIRFKKHETTDIYTYCMENTEGQTKSATTQSVQVTTQTITECNESLNRERNSFDDGSVSSEDSVLGSLSSSSFISFVLAEEDDLEATAKARVLDIFRSQYARKIAEKEQIMTTLKKEIERREQELKTFRNEIKKLEGQIARVKTIIREKEVSLCSLSDRLEDIQYERGFLKRKESLCDARIHEFIADNEVRSKKLKKG